MHEHIQKPLNPSHQEAWHWDPEASFHHISSTSSFHRATLTAHHRSNPKKNANKIPQPPALAQPNQAARAISREPARLTSGSSSRFPDHACRGIRLNRCPSPAAAAAGSIAVTWAAIHTTKPIKAHKISTSSAPPAGNNRPKKKTPTGAREVSNPKLRISRARPRSGRGRRAREATGAARVPPTPTRCTNQRARGRGEKARRARRYHRHRHSLAIASARHLLLRCALLCSPDAEGLVEWGWRGGEGSRWGSECFFSGGKAKCKKNKDLVWLLPVRFLICAVGF